MLGFEDEEIEALLGAGGLKAPEINCASGNRVERFCCKGSCTMEAACCSDDDCKNCEARHEACPFIGLKKLTKYAEGRLFLVRKTVADILKAENDLLNQLNASRKLLIEKIKERQFEERHLSPLDNFFSKGDPMKLKGK
jgi:hypothetical protein